MAAKRGDEFLAVLDVARRVKGSIKKQTAGDDWMGQEEKNKIRLLKAVVKGDTGKIRKLLQDPTLDVYVRDNVGRTPLQLAVDSGNIEVTEMLLGRYNANEISRVLMQAISRDQEIVAETIVRHPRYDRIFPPPAPGNKEGAANERLRRQFQGNSLDVGPLVLAAQHNQFGLVQILLLRGESIEAVHEPNCQCDNCRQMFKLDQLMLAKLRLETYRGLASEAYVSLASVDPIATAFDLAKELRKLASVEKHYKKEYTELAKNLSEYIYRLMDEIKTNEELEKILNKAGHRERYGHLSRISQAIENEEKHFVAHPSCQRALTETWYSGSRAISNKTILIWLIGLFYLIFSPLVFVVYQLAPKTKVGRIISTPFMRFLASIVWDLYFIAIIIMTAYLTGENKKTPDFDPKTTTGNLYKFYTYMSFPTDKGIREVDINKLILTGFIGLWIVGLLWGEIKQLFQRGIHIYIRNWFNVIDSAIIIFYSAGGGMIVVSAISEITFQSSAINEKSVPYTSLTDTTAADHQRALFLWYWVIPDRHYWSNGDPLLVSDCLFAAGCILTFGRFFYYLSASSSLGPIQIALGKIMKDILKFMIILTVAFVAFFVGLQNLYSYYSEAHRTLVEAKAPNSTNPVSATKYFGSNQECLKTMFWALFGMGEYTTVEITDGENPYTDHEFTELMGYLLYGMYTFVTRIVLLNLLIAIMSETFEEVSKSNDREWKFARARLYMDYVSAGTQPLPLNWIPSPKSWFYLFTGKYCKEDYRPPQCCWRMCNYSDITKGNTHQNDSTVIEMTNKARQGGILADSDGSTYQGVMRNIIKRYLQRKQVADDDEAGGIEEIKKEILNLKQTLQFKLSNSRSAMEASVEVAVLQNTNLSEFNERLDTVEVKVRAVADMLRKVIFALSNMGATKDKMKELNVDLTLNAELPQDVPAIQERSSGPIDRRRGSDDSSGSSEAADGTKRKKKVKQIRVKSANLLDTQEDQAPPPKVFSSWSALSYVKPKATPDAAPSSDVLYASNLADSPVPPAKDENLDEFEPERRDSFWETTVKPRVPSVMALYHSRDSGETPLISTTPETSSDTLMETHKE